MASSIFCDGVRRRDFIKVGAIGGLGIASGRLPAARRGRTSRSGEGPLGHLSSICKAARRTSTRSTSSPRRPPEFAANSSRSRPTCPGMEICEHLPKLAKCADKFTILRGVSHTLGAHDLGTDYMNTGNRPTAVARLSELRRGGQPRDAGREGTARRRGDSEHQSAGPATWACNMPRWKRAPRRSSASRSPSAAFRFHAG